MSRTTIIVGAGSGGGALAARLSEDAEETVILVEAGPDYESMEYVPEDLLDAGTLSVEKHDWKMSAYFVEPKDKKEIQPYPRGRVVGGSSAVNAAIAVRAAEEDFDLWVELGNDKWSYEQTLPYYKRSETDLDFGDRDEHGDSGPVPIVRFTSDEWDPATQGFVQAALDKGFPACEDFNARKATGVGGVTRNLLDGNRASSLVTYLAQARGRENLRIRSSTTCRRVLFDGTKAIGIEVEDETGEISTISGDRVVLAAGAILSPHILMLSGVGPKDVLTQFGIETVVESPGVGQGLMDHIIAPVITLLKEPTEFLGVRAVVKFTTERSKVTDDMMLFSALIQPEVMNLPFPTGGRLAMVLNSVLSKPQSVGWLTLTSADVHDQPEIHINFLEAQQDVYALMDSMRLAYELATTQGVLDHADVVAPTPDVIADDEKLEAFVRSIGSTSYHATSTCRMGPDGDEMAVVDQDLAVRGTTGLWIGDMSVVPRVPTGLTNLTAYMVGEKLSDTLRG